MLQDVGDDVGQVVEGDNFLLVAKLGDALGDAARLLGCQLETQLLQVLDDVGTARVLAQGILPLAAEALGNQLVVVELVLAVAIGMDTCHLGKDVLADDGLVGGDGDAAEAFDHAREVVQLALDDVGLGVELVLEDGLYAGQRGIATSLP